MTYFMNGLPRAYVNLISSARRGVLRKRTEYESTCKGKRNFVKLGGNTVKYRPKRLFNRVFFMALFATIGR